MPSHPRRRFSRLASLAVPLAAASLCGPTQAASDASCQSTHGSDAAVAGIEQLLAARRAVDALACAERLAPVFPGDARFHRLHVAALSDLGASAQVWDLYRARPDLFSTEQGERFLADHLARLVGWSSQFPERADRPLADAERANAAIDEYLRSSGRRVADLPLRIRLDRMLVLNRLQRHAEVVAEYAALQATGATIPGYVHGVAGDSLLAERQPEAAAKALDAALAVSPMDAGLQVQRAYAALEMEDHADARARLAAYRDLQAPWLREPGAATPAQNWRRYETDLNAPLLLAFGEDLPEAQALLEERIAIGPANAGLQAALGTVYLLRGWPERALERFRIASTLDARAVNARIGQVGALTALQRDDEARAVRDALVADQGRLPSVQRMDRDWRIHRGVQARAWVSGGRSRGGGGTSPLGSRDREAGIEIASPLIDDRWRLVAVHDQRWADFRGERIEDRRNGVGLRYAHDRLDARLLFSRPRDGVGGTGAAAALGWRFDDAWSLRATAARNDAEGSLQARAAGITADSVGIGVDYVPDERTAWRASATQWRYDDGNRREALSLGVDQRLFTRPHFLLNGVAGAYASRGSRDDAPYFNPARDASFEFALRADHLLWRRYERQYRHRLTLGGGSYHQQGHGSAWVPRASYEHAWRFAPGRELVYGVEWSRPVYDGQRETRTGFNAGFRWGE